MIILVICITGVLVYSAAVALFIAAKMGHVHISIRIGRKSESAGIENIYIMPEGEEEPVVTDGFLDECRRIKEKYKKDKTVLTSGVAASEYEMPETSRHDKEGFNMDMILEQIEDYGKYKGILKCDDERCEYYLPVSIAKRIVRARGIGGVLGYLEENK